MLLNRSDVLRVVAHVQQPAVHLRMKGLYSSIEHLGKTGQF